MLQSAADVNHGIEIPATILEPTGSGVAVEVRNHTGSFKRLKRDADIGLAVEVDQFLDT